MGLYRSEISKDQTMYKLSIIYLSMFLHIYSFMIEFLLVIEFCTIIRCIKFEFQRANKLLEDSNVQCSITKELIEQREPYGSLSIERSLFVCSEQLLNSPSLRQTQSRLKIARHKINSNKTLLRTIRQIHLELYRVSKRFSNMYGIQISLEIGMCVILVIFVLYRFYAKYRAKTYDINELIFEFINIIFLCLQYTIKIFIINYICDKTRNEVEIFSLQMMQCRNPYSAYGLYNLNCKHICSSIHETDMAGILATVTFVGNALFYIIALFNGLMRRKRLKLFIEQLETCTQKIDELNISRTYISFFQYHLILCDILWFYDTEISIEYRFILYFFDNYPLIVTMVNDVTFVFWIRQINFGQLNAVLQSMLTTTIDSPQHKRVLRMKDNWENDSSLSMIYGTYKANENLLKLKRVKRIHLELIKCARIITKAYGILILMSTTLSAVFIIVLLYFLYTIVFTYNGENWREISFVLSYWIAFFFVKIFMINNICETTVAEIRDFAFQLTQNRLTFTACGFYDLDHTFICDFQRTIMPLIIANSVVCTGLLEYFVDQPIRIIGFFYAMFCSVYYSILFYTFKEILDVSVRVQSAKVGRIITKFRFVNNAFVYVIAIFVGLSKRKRIKLFIGQLETCTRETDELNIPRNYSSLFRYQCIIGIFIIFMISGLIIDNLYWYADINLPFSYILTLQFHYFDNYPYIVTMITDFTFVFWIKCIKMKFGQLNAVLQSMLTTTIDSPQHKRVLRMKDNWEDDSLLSTVYRTYKANENLLKLKRIKRIHLELMKCARITNEAYEMRILTSISSCVIFIITFLYSLYSVSITNSYNNWMNEFYSHFYWIFYFAIKIFAINNICETTIAEIRDFAFQLTQNRLTFTACGFYDLDHTFICGAIGSITTYLVILIQIGDKPKVFFNDMNYNSTSRI
ncbi:gustatory receptor for sugar taste 43a-like [Vespula squamosa]|uniref:Gustatory receptor for sugar taste 43a-like n=1 Tax=Vespula squamosa TaxID=30214 RepID=A0ABD2AY04_VESSQ